MPAKSKSQQRLMGMVHAEQKGEDTGSDKAKELARTMKPKAVTEFAETDHEGLPEKEGKKGPWKRTWSPLKKKIAVKKAARQAARELLGADG